MLLGVVAAICLTAGVASAVTDLEVTCIEHDPKYASYRGHVAYDINRTYVDDFLPYTVDVAWGLWGQDPGTKRWPDAGETLTFTGHILNRSDAAITQFDYQWHLDGLPVGNGTWTGSLLPGADATVTIPWQWQSSSHSHPAQRGYAFSLLGCQAASHHLVDVGSPSSPRCARL